MNNKEFDQFLRNEVDSINFGGGEQAWEQFSAAKVDQQIKSEVEAIKYPDGEMAWKQFSAQHAGEESPRRRFAYWRPLIAAASLAILVGVMLHHSSNDGTVNLKQVAATPSELESDDSTINIVSPIQTVANAVVVEYDYPEPNVITPQKTIAAIESIETIQVNTDVGQNTFVPAQNIHIDDATPLNEIVEAISYRTRTPQTIATINKSTTTTNNSVADTVDDKSAYGITRNALVNSMNLLPAIGLSDLEQPVGFASVEKQLDIAPSKNRRLNLFAEIGIGNRQSGLRLLTGVSVPMNSWSVETGIGVMNKANRPMFFSQELQSEIFPDFEEYHDYTFIQKVSMIVPLRIKKRIWKRHNIVVGARGSYNFSNQVDIESIVPNVTPQFGPGSSTGGVPTPQVDLGKEVYKYNNIGSAANAYSVVTSNRLNLDIIAGYELDLSRVSIGVSLAKPVFSSFRITDGVEGPVLFHILEDPSINFSLKYTFI